VLAADEAAVTSIRGSLMALLGALQDLPWLVLIPVLAFFFLKDAATIRRPQTWQKSRISTGRPSCNRCKVGTVN